MMPDGTQPARSLLDIVNSKRSVPLALSLTARKHVHSLLLRLNLPKLDKVLLCMGNPLLVVRGETCMAQRPPRPLNLQRNARESKDAVSDFEVVDMI